ncbi:MAG: cytochrome c peroxidase [Thermodesulfobacteriota bacterium]
MSKAKLVVAILAGTILLAGGQAMAGKSSVELGKKLFNDPTLGGSTNDKSCNSCHADGEGLEKAGDNKKLVKVINQCITGPLKGKKIDGRTADMRSLKMYIKSLQAK